MRTRILKNRGIVAVADSMIEHYTKKFSQWQILIGLFVKNNFYEKILWNWTNSS